MQETGATNPMHITVLTMFPQSFDSFKDTPVLNRAVRNGEVSFTTVDIKDFADGSFRHIDDSPCGGGPGMVLRVDTLHRALEASRTPSSHVVMLSPKGARFDQKKARGFASMKDLVLVCGHYEGIDARFERYVDEQVSIGDFILTGGELAAMVVTDSVVRLLKGSLRDGSADDESFERRSGCGSKGLYASLPLLEYPQYTHPVEYNGDEVASVLLGGDQRAIGKWKMSQSIMETVKYRPDLLKEASETVGKSKASLYVFDMPNASDSMVLKAEPVSETAERASAIREYEALSWLDGRLPVPKVVGHHVADGTSYILMSKVKGRMLCDPSILSNRRRLLKSAVAALRTLWSVDVSNCPLDSGLDRDLEIATYNVEHGIVDFPLSSNCGYDLPSGVESAADLLCWLQGNRPKMDDGDRVFSHGDLCLPNVLVDCKGIAGFVDLGGAGCADRWRDIAICVRSLKDNLVGRYANEYAASHGLEEGLLPFGAFDEREFFDVLGMAPNEEKLRYYTLLDELM